MKYRIDYIFTVVLATLLASSCHYKKQDDSMAISPIEISNTRYIHVQNNIKGNAVDIHCSGHNHVPVWCNIRPNHYQLVRKLNYGISPVKDTVKNTQFLCYSGEYPAVDEHYQSQCTDVLPPIHEEKVSKSSSIEEAFYPYQNLYILAFLLSIDSKCVIYEFFHLYTSFCSQSGVHCCILPYGDKFILNMVMEGIDDSGPVKGVLSEFKNYFKRTKIHRKDYASPVEFNIFKSSLLDNCSLQRFYYDAFYSGIQKPQALLDYANWDKDYCQKKSIKVLTSRLKVLDTKKMHERELKSLKSNLDNILK